MTIYQIDAFTDRIFGGNPAAVIPLTEWLPDQIMQRIAAENNLAETAFVVPEGDYFRIRWFTPAVEVDLCGHATIAAAYVWFKEMGYPGDRIQFQSKSGELSVTKEGSWFTLDFPADELTTIAISASIQACCSPQMIEAYKGRSDYLFILENQNAVLNGTFDLSAIQQLGDRGVIVTARGDEVDFVSRFFAPYVGIPEDPVTGSAHTTLIPYWAGRLGKNNLTARQLSARGGFIRGFNAGSRVMISGQAVLYMKGEIANFPLL